MAGQTNITGGIGELPIGVEREQLKAFYSEVRTQVNWDTLTNVQKDQRIRRFIKFYLEQTFGHLKNG